MNNKLNLKSDFIFKEVFSSNDDLSRGALRDLLSTYIGKEVKNVEVIQNEIRSSYLLQKETRMDINVIFNDGERADIEMQLFNQKDHLSYRMTYYLTQLFTSQPMKGKEYSQLHNTYIIVIANFTIYQDKREYRHFMMRDENNELLNELLHIIMIELPKVKDQKVEDMDAIKMWNYYLKNYHNKKKAGIIELIKNKMEGIAMADEKITQISPEEVARIRQIYDDLFALEEEMRLNRLLKKSKAEGLAEGESKGLSKGIKQTQAMMIHKLLQKHTIEEVAEMLDMPIDEVKTSIEVNTSTD